MTVLPFGTIIQVFFSGPGNVIVTGTANYPTSTFIGLTSTQPIDHVSIQAQIQSGGGYPVVDNFAFGTNAPNGQGSCQVQLPALLSQRDTRWSTHPYNTTGVDTIGAVGCALTSLSMALNYAGLNTTPDSLNSFMDTVGGYDIVKDKNGGLDALVDWDTTTSAASTGSSSPFKLSPPQKLKFVSNVVNSIVDPVGASQVLSNSLCAATPHPVIVGVDLTWDATKRKYSAGHYVLVTGKQINPDGTANFLIADPYFNSNPSSPSISVRTSLDDLHYNNHYETRGTVIDPPDDNSRLNFAIGGVADILVVDPMGRRIGFDPASGTILSEIPDASHWTDRLDNDDSGEPDSNSANFVQILQPMTGTYQIVITGFDSGPYTLSENVVSQDGTLQPEQTFTGTVSQGTMQTAISQLNTTPGGSSGLSTPKVQCTGCYFLINGVRATLAFNVSLVGSTSTFTYNYRTATQTVQFASTTTSQISVSGNTPTFSGQGKLNGVAGYSFTVTAKDGGGVGSGLDTVSVTITGPSNYSYSANGTIAGGDIVVKQ